MGRATKKVRVPIPEETVVEINFRSQRTCCICNVPGLPYEIHHIDEDPSNNELENLAILCKNHHYETQIYGGFSRKLDAATVKKNRDEWYARVQKRKDDADNIATKAMAGIGIEHIDEQSADWLVEAEGIDETLIDFLFSLPELRKNAHIKARKLFEHPNTQATVEGCDSITDFAQSIWIALNRWFPQNHFGDTAPPYFIENFIYQRSSLHNALAEPGEPGSGGTIVRTVVAYQVSLDTEDLVVKTVEALLPRWETQTMFKKWKSAWDAAVAE